MVIDMDALFSAWVATVGRTAMSDTEFGAVYRRLMAAIVRFDHVVVFAYRGSERPIDLYSTFNPEEHHVYVALYQDGPYLLDPFFAAVRELKAGLLRMRELAPDRFFSSEYYRNYYVQTGLAEEVGFFVPVGNDITIVLSLMRKETTGIFPAAELALLKKAEALVVALVGHVWGHLSERFDAQKKVVHRNGRRRSGNGSAPAMDRVWARLNLTGREAAIVELVLQGHSSESIGLRLNISTGTVKVHRRNVYRKLGISSQFQLLALYLDSLRQDDGNLQAGPAG